MRRMGPGIAAGIADDDPSAIGTFSQIGAAFGFAFVWAPLLALPIIAAAQVTATNLGYVTRRCLGGIAVRRMPRVLVAALFLPIVVASSFTVGADLHAMAAAAHLVVAIREWLVLVALTAATLLLQIFVPYRRYRSVLQWAGVEHPRLPRGARRDAHRLGIGGRRARDARRVAVAVAHHRVDRSVRRCRLAVPHRVASKLGSRRVDPGRR